VVLIEKTWRWDPAAGREADVAALALAVAVIWLPWLAPGLHAAVDDELTGYARLGIRRPSAENLCRTEADSIAPDRPVLRAPNGPNRTGCSRT
jgi:hypothetical protein